MLHVISISVTDNSCQVWLCTKTSANTLITVVYLTINISFVQLPAFTCYSVFTAALFPTISSTYNYWHTSQVIITLNIKDGLAFIKQMQLHTACSYPLSHPSPFDYNYTCRRVKWGEQGIYPTLATLVYWHFMGLPEPREILRYTYF